MRETEAQPPERSGTFWAAAVHLSAFGGWILPWLGQVLFPVVVWWLSRDQDPFVDDQGMEAINFGTTMALIDACIWILLFSVGLDSPWTPIALLSLSVSVTFQSVFLIIAAVKAKAGTRYRYPICLRLF